MTTYYAEGEFGIVRFDGPDPSEDINADAKFWTPEREEWHPCPGSTGIGADVVWSGDYYPIPEHAVPEMQRRCREALARRRLRSQKG